MWFLKESLPSHVKPIIINNITTTIFHITIFITSLELLLLLQILLFAQAASASKIFPFFVIIIITPDI